MLAPEHFEFADNVADGARIRAGEALLRKPSDLIPRVASLYVAIGSHYRQTGIEMARTPVLAAGGIVLRQAATPLVAIVRLRKRNEWVLPKGKLDRGETPRAAAEREVNEETGHDVAVHEFLGTLVYESRGGSKVVHFWRMEAGRRAGRKLMRDVKAVEWLPLADAVERLSRGYERAFLENVGPIALSAEHATQRGAPVDERRSLRASKRSARSAIGAAWCKKCGTGFAARRDASPLMAWP